MPDQELNDVEPFMSAGVTASDEVPARVDLGSRFTDWRTLASFAFALVILFIALKKSQVDPHDVRLALDKVNPWLFGAAFVVYYLSFPLRAYRWRMLMLNANTGEDMARVGAYSFWGLNEILYLSWFANCVIPAKLGDIYRAYLARNAIGIPASRTVGTILAERVLDLLILFPMLFIAALLTFRDHLLSADSTLRNVLLGALGLGVLAAAVVFAIWRFGDNLRGLLPQRVHSIFTMFREGALHSFRAGVGKLVALTILVWACEGGRLFLVLASLNLIEPNKLGVSAALFLALGSSVLTTIPFAPGGLGLVETFLIAALQALKVDSTSQAAAVALLDRVISYLSIVVIGFLLYIFSSKTRPAARPPTVGRTPGGRDTTGRSPGEAVAPVAARAD